MSSARWCRRGRCIARMHGDRGLGAAGDNALGATTSTGLPDGRYGPVSTPRLHGGRGAVRALVDAVGRNHGHSNHARHHASGPAPAGDAGCVRGSEVGPPLRVPQLARHSDDRCLNWRSAHSRAVGRSALARRQMRAFSLRRVFNRRLPSQEGSAWVQRRLGWERSRDWGVGGSARRTRRSLACRAQCRGPVAR